MNSGSAAKPPPNDAALIQRVRGALGRDPVTRRLPRINVGSCSFVVSLHGAVSGGGAAEVERVVRSVPGTLGVENKLKAFQAETG